MPRIFYVDKPEYSENDPFSEILTIILFAVKSVIYTRVVTPISLSFGGILWSIQNT